MSRWNTIGSPAGWAVSYNGHSDLLRFAALIDFRCGALPKRSPDTDGNSPPSIIPDVSAIEKKFKRFFAEPLHRSQLALQHPCYPVACDQKTSSILPTALRSSRPTTPVSSPHSSSFIRSSASLNLSHGRPQGNTPLTIRSSPKESAIDGRTWPPKPA